jgi:hypothetical protein
MAERVLHRMDSFLYRMRFLIVAACAAVTCLLALSQNVEATCGVLDNCWSNQCENACMHTTDYWGYFDPECLGAYCCVQGPCYWTNQPYCYYCASQDNAFCGYEHGCP